LYENIADQVFNLAMTRKRRRSGKTVPKKSNAAGLTALALCFTRQLQLQAPPAAVVAGEPAGGPSAAAAAAAAANLLFSPVAVYAALALLAAGARGGTLQELLDALGGDSRDDLAAPRSARSRTGRGRCRAVGPPSRSRAACGSTRRGRSCRPSATPPPRPTTPRRAPSTSVTR